MASLCKGGLYCFSFVKIATFTKKNSEQEGQVVGGGVTPVEQPADSSLFVKPSTCWAKRKRKRTKEKKGKKPPFTEGVTIKEWF